jgi:hypothetical protein
MFCCYQHNEMESNECNIKNFSKSHSLCLLVTRLFVSRISLILIENTSVCFCRLSTLNRKSVVETDFGLWIVLLLSLSLLITFVPCSLLENPCYVFCGFKVTSLERSPAS